MPSSHPGIIILCYPRFNFICFFPRMESLLLGSLLFICLGLLPSFGEAHPPVFCQVKKIVQWQKACWWQPSPCLSSESYCSNLGGLSYMPSAQCDPKFFLYHQQIRFSSSLFGISWFFLCPMPSLFPLLSIL